MLWLYALLTSLLSPLAGLVLLLRGESLRRTGERFGQGLPPAPAAPVLWFHAASVGEFRAIKPLILRDWGGPVVVTVQSRQGLATAQAEAGDRATVLAAPFDTPFAITRFLDRFRPRGLVLVESELWPGWMDALDRQGIPAVLLDGSVSAQSARHWARWPGLLAPIRRALKAVTVASTDRAAPFEALGLGPVRTALPLKLAGQALPVDAALVAHWQAWRRDGAPLITFANVHPTEIPALKSLIADHIPPNAQLIIAPRHPDRLPAFEQAFAGMNSGDGDGEKVGFWTGFGTLGSLFSLDGMVVVGGGFEPNIGSHNPLESMRFNRLTICGPESGKQAALIDVLQARGLVTQLPDWPAKDADASTVSDSLSTLADQAAQDALNAIQAVLHSKEP